MIIIFWTGWRYFSKGTQDLTVWGEFLLPLSFQDALVSYTVNDPDFRSPSWRSPLSYTSVIEHGV